MIESNFEYIQNRIVIDLETKCWNWTGTLCKDGYGKCKRKGKTYRTHRLSYEYYKGEFDNNLYVCHSCDNPKCVNPDHLWLGTHFHNELDKTLKGRRSPSPSISHPHLIPKGEKIWSSKLTKEVVEEIYKLGLKNYTAKQILDKLNLKLHTSTINRIMTGKSWAHLNLAEKYGVYSVDLREKNSATKLNKKIVANIKQSRLSKKELSEKYNVTVSTISYILSGKTWKDVV